jgi:hypothetical protein
VSLLGWKNIYQRRREVDKIIILSQIAYTKNHAEGTTVYPPCLYLAYVLSLLLWFPLMRVFLSFGW